MAKLNTVTSSTRPASPAAGETYFETDSNKIIVWDGSAWTELVSDYAPSFSNTYSVDFDGTNDYVDISGVASSLNGASTFSMSLWYKTSSDGVLISGGTASSNAFWIYRVHSGLLYFNVRNGATTYLQVLATNNDNAWNHIVAIVNGSSSAVYVNGTQAVTGTLPSLSSTGANNTAIGYSASQGGYYIDGFIDEVAIFNSALSASDVASLRDTSGSNPVPADISSLTPVGWWRMGDNDSGTGTTITDQGSGGNDATLTNGPTFSTDIPS